MVGNLSHALTVDLTTASSHRAITLPAVRVRMGDLVQELAQQTGATADLVSYAPDSSLEAAFGSLPPLTTTESDRFAFSNDGELSELVARTLAGIESDNPRTTAEV